MAPDPSVHHLTIGELASIRLSGNIVELPPSSQGFDGSPDPACNVLFLEVSQERIEPIPDLELLLDSTSLWKVSSTEKHHVIDMPHVRTIVDFDRAQGTIQIDHGHDFTFDYPLDEVLFSRLLAHRNAVIVHACAVDYHGRGILMCGNSGAGKSTICALLDRIDGARVLSDDRVALSTQDGRPHVTGTPWHGTSGFGLNETTTLNRILFLEHGSRNHIDPIPDEDAAIRLASLSVIPYWHVESSQRALDTTVDVCSTLGASTFEFSPEPSAVELLLDVGTASASR